MKHFVFFLFLLGMIIPASGLANISEEKIPFDSLPQWINQHVMFPHDALKYGTVGTEHFVLSVAWNGKPYISSPLNVLNPAIENAIMDVVEKAPICVLSGTNVEDIYKVVTVDFTRLIPENIKDSIKCVSLHSFPTFTEKTSVRKTPITNSRQIFINWLYDKCHSFKHNVIPLGYKDTLTLNYAIDVSGKVKNVSVENCENGNIQTLLESIMKKSPKWLPAKDKKGERLNILVRESVIFEVDENGNLMPLKLYKRDACKNTSLAVTDSNMIVPNPEIPPLYKESEGKSILQAIQASMPKDTWFYLNTTFVVDKEGKVQDVKIGTNNTCPDSTVRTLLAQSDWVAAKQGGIAVNSCYTLRGLVKNSEHRRTYPVPDYYPDFMLGGSLPPFVYDPLYDKGLQKRWRKLQMAYPELNGEINGYAKSRRLTKGMYREMMMQKGH